MAEKTTNGFLGGADSLVPRTIGAVGAILGDAAVARDADAGSLDASLGLLVLSLGLILSDLALSLIAGVASQTANSALNGTGCRVHVGLESGGGLLLVGLVRHDGGVGYFGSG